MWLSAAKLFSIVSVWFGPQQLNSEEAGAWKRVSPSVVMVLQGGMPKGGAALIDDQGLFLVHKSAMTMTSAVGRFETGETVQLTLISSDDPTQLALLRADTWIRGRHPVLAVSDNKGGIAMTRDAALPVRTSAQKPERNSVLAILPGGTPIRAELTASDRIGIVNPARRVMTLSEFRFEAPPQSVGGSLLFSLDGRLIGILGATLGGDDGIQGDVASRTKLETAFAGAVNTQSTGRVGPAPLTVGYSIGPDILQRVVDGFRSPSHQVEHPALGILCKDAPQGGALVDTVLHGSPAEIGGILAGDVIVELDGQVVSDQIDYARFMLKQNVGAEIKAKVSRNGRTVSLTIKVGK